MQWGTGDVSECTKTNVSDGTSTIQGKHVHLCQIILKSMHKVKIMAWIMTFYHLTFMCDLDLQPTQINVSNGTTTPQGERLYKIILKSMHKCGSYGLDNTHTYTLANYSSRYLSLYRKRLNKNESR